MTARVLERGSDGRRGIPRRILDAARRKFLYYGVNRTTMADIGRELGMPRQALYDYVSSRDELVDAVLVARISEIAEEVSVPDECPASVAFVEASLDAIRRARRDPELMNVVATGPSDRVQAVVTGPHAEIHEIVGRLLDPVLSRAGEDGGPRTDRSRDEIIDWVRIVYLSLITQLDIDPDRERALVEGFLLPSVIRPPA
jgi:AcrR family transcriptional regulator